MLQIWSKLLSVKKCLIILCLCVFVYGDENVLNANALDENVSSVNLAQDELNLNENSATLINTATPANAENSATPEKDKNSTNPESTASSINSEPATLTSTENNASSEVSSDESDFGFDEFEAEFESFKVNDPLSGYNKMMTRFNVALYTYALRPIAKGYEFVMPEFARLGIKNFASYINMPIRFLGNVLQLKFKEAGTEVKRFGVNTIFGFFGLIDAASKAQIPLHHADFGLVLAHWGVGGGFHFVLPVLGPSNLRDTLSIPVNWYASPITYAATYDSSAWINWLSVGITSFVMINEASLNTPTLDEIFYKTPNLYPFLRDAYEKRRMEMAK